MRILVLNSGSSSLKADLYEFDREQSEQLPPPEPLLQRNLEWTSSSTDSLLASIVQQAGHLDAVGHRIVHGGVRYRDSTVITTEVRQALAGCAEIAPLHTGRELEVLDAAARAIGINVPQIAVFDTAFHTTLAPAAYTYAIPDAWVRDGIRRYGFHGLSYQYSSRRAAQMLGEREGSRLLVCHLGSGASMCAIKDGKSVDTTMGFTPLEGLVMATRSGSIDPGILMYLQRHKGSSSDDLERILNRESGLAALSGTSGDLRQILSARQNGDIRAGLAFDVYLHSLVRHAGMMAAVLGGLDTLVFTGGVGENSEPVREALCQKLAYLGVLIDSRKNVQGDTPIHADSSLVRVLVIHAREEWEIARECSKLVTLL